MNEVIAGLQHFQEQLGGAPLGISRASWLLAGAKERDLVRDLPWSVIPVVGGQTVWSAGPTASTPVIEIPNWFGCIEKAAFHATPTITVMWWEPGIATGAATIAAHRTAGSISTARNLAGRLRQIPGVALPHGQPESPWFIVSLPDNAANAATRLHEAGFAGCLPLAGFPEFPGGMRIEVAWPSARNAQFAELLQRSLER